MNQNDLSSALCDMYDIRNILPNKVKNQPKDNDGTETTIGDCLDSVIQFLEEMEKQMPKFLEDEANEAFYAYEQKLFPQGDESNLSDNDRNLFVTGYVIATLKIKEKQNA